MKWYDVPDGTMGLRPDGKWQLFETSDAYIKWYLEEIGDR